MSKFSEEESELLWSLFDTYVTVQSSDKKYDLFWAAMTQKYYQRWPAIETLFPGRDPTGKDLNETESQKVKDFLKKNTEVRKLQALAM